MLKDAGDGVYTMVHIDVAWFCVCASWAVQRWGRIYVLFVVVVGESASSLGEIEGFVWKVSASCHQHMHDLKSLRMFKRTDST